MSRHSLRHLPKLNKLNVDVVSRHLPDFIYLLAPMSMSCRDICERELHSLQSGVSIPLLRGKAILPPLARRPNLRCVFCWRDASVVRSCADKPDWFRGGAGAGGRGGCVGRPEVTRGRMTGAARGVNMHSWKCKCRVVSRHLPEENQLNVDVVSRHLPNE